MTLRHLALVSETDRVPGEVLLVVAAALQTQILRDYAPAWGIAATVDAFDDLEDVPSGHFPLIVRDDIDVNSAGVHVDSNHTPFALINFSNRWTLTASHEALEMATDPFGHRLQPADSVDPRQGRVDYLVAICDPSRATSFAYRINGVVVSDFYLPAFFHPVANRRVSYSFTGALTRPLQVLEGGYLSWRDPTTNIWWQQRWFDTPEPTLHELGVVAGSEPPRRWTDARVVSHHDEAVAGVDEGTEDYDMLVAAYALAVRDGAGSCARAARLRKEIAALRAR
jgi:hypothetical protein